MFPRPPAHHSVDDDGGYRRIELPEGEWQHLRKVMSTQPKTGLNKAICERLELAEYVALPWIEITWRFAEAWAAVGYDVVAQIFDGFHAVKEPEAHVKREIEAMGGE